MSDNNSHGLPVGGVPRPGISGQQGWWSPPNPDATASTREGLQVVTPPTTTPAQEQVTPDEPSASGDLTKTDSDVWKVQPHVTRTSHRAERPNLNIGKLWPSKQTQELLLPIVAVVASVAWIAAKGPVLLTSALVVVTAILVLRGLFRSPLYAWLLPIRCTPPDRPPTRGIQGKFWKYFGAQWLYLRFKWPWLASVSLREREQRADDDIWALHDVQKIIVPMNTNGGAGKSTLADYWAALLCMVLRRPVIACDVNESPGWTAQGFGIARDQTISFLAFVRSCKQLMTVEKFDEVAASDRLTGVSAITSEKMPLESIALAGAFEGLTVAKGLCHCLFPDPGNVIRAPGNLAAIHMADTLGFPGYVGKPQSLEDITNTMESLTELGYGDKVQEGVIVILGGNIKDRVKYADRYGLPLYRVFVVPHDNYMKGTPDKVNRVYPAKIRRISRVVLKESLVAALKALPAVNPELPSDLMTDTRVAGPNPIESLALSTEGN